MARAQSLNHSAEFQAKRAETMPADKLKINVDQRRLLVETADRSAFVKPATRFSLRTDGSGCGSAVARGPHQERAARPDLLPLRRLSRLQHRPALLRPASRPELRRLGATLVGVSPQAPEKLRHIKDRHHLDFLIATDADNALGRRFGILYSFDEPSRRASIESGSLIGEVTGTGTWELPMPAAVVIDQAGTVRFADVSPDWLVRTEPDDIIAAVQHHCDPSGRLASPDRRRNRRDNFDQRSQPRRPSSRPMTTITRRSTGAQNGVKVIPGNSLDPNTAQTPGMNRATAISKARAGAERSGPAR